MTSNKMSVWRVRPPMTAALILIAAAAFAKEPRDIPFDDTRVFPESLGASRDGTLYIGSWKGIVYRARPGETLATPWIKPSANNGLLTILGVLPDDRAGWIWVCSVPAPAREPPARGISALMAFDMNTGEQKLNLPFPAPASVCNDISLAQDGTAYVSDTPNGRVFRVRSQSLELLAQDEQLRGIDGIVFSGDGTLYANSVTSNRLWRIAIDRAGHVGAITQLILSKPLNGADGFRLIRGNAFLLAENTAGCLDEVRISGDRATITVIKQGLDTPTSAIVVGRTIYGVERKIEFVANPALKGRDPGPFKVFALPLPSL
jgi:outer membrane protein assembly factor BamB